MNSPNEPTTESTSPITPPITTSRPTPSKPILLVSEGSRHAAETLGLASLYDLLTWAPWTPLPQPIRGRVVTIWPDSPDDLGAARGLAALLKATGNNPVKIIYVEPGATLGAALAAGQTLADVLSWARPLVSEYGAHLEPELPPLPEGYQEQPPPPGDEHSVSDASTPEDHVFSEDHHSVTPLQGLAQVIQIPARSPDLGPPNATAALMQCGVQLTDKGHPITNIANLSRVISGWNRFSGKIWYDEFFNRILTTAFNLPGDTTPREWSDYYDIEMTAQLQSDFQFLKASTQQVHDAVYRTAFHNLRNAPRDWMSTLVWDGTSRIDEFLTLYMGAAANVYTYTVSRNFWIALAARTYRAGCQMDNMVVLEGAQGIRKSSALRTLAGDWYAANSAPVNSKDFEIGLQGSLIVEIPELQSFGKADTNTIKQKVSTPVDSYRVPYGRATGKHPRRGLIVGTTNEDEYLRDVTGARRFWPVKCGIIDIAKIEIDRDQLFAEGVHRYRNGESWWEMPPNETKAEQELRQEYDAWTSAVVHFLSSDMNVLTRGYVQAHEIWVGGLGGTLDKFDKSAQMRLTAILTKLLWTRDRIGPASVRTRVWRGPPQGGSL